MPRDALNADEQGEKGQSRFREICADAQLVCNESTRDRTGWDFLVEFPLANPQTVRSIDNRPAPISSHFQVKTLVQGRDQFKMRLSSAERLAREAKPTFIYVFKVNGSEFGESLLLHVTDEILAKILRRLRQEHAAGNASTINQKYITFFASRYGMPLPPTGDALRAAVEKACGTSLQEYMTRKSVQVRQLGFEPRPYKGTLRFIGLRDLDEIAETFLGLRRDVEVDLLNASETRFGIALPLPELTGKNLTISIDPSPIDSCTIIVRHKMLELPTIFDAEVFVPLIPHFPREAFKVCLKSRLFSLLVSGVGGIDIRLAEDLMLQAHPPERWVDHARLMTGLALGKIKIEIRSKTRSDYSEFEIDEIDEKIAPDPWRRWLKLCEFASHLFRIAGASNDLCVRIEDIEAPGSLIVEAGALLSRQVGRISFRSQVTGGEIGGPARAVFVSYVKIGTAQIAYYAIIDFSLEIAAEFTQWTSTCIIPGCARMITGSQAEFNAFVEEAKNEAGTNISIVQRSPDGTAGVISST
jgi:hypothetical protein